MPLTTVYQHLTRLWIRGGRWVVMLTGLAGLLWACTAAFRSDFPTQAEMRHPHEMEVRHLEMTCVTRKDLAPDFSQGVSEPLNRWLPHRTDGIVRPLWPWLAAWMMDEREEMSGAQGMSLRFATRIQQVKVLLTVSLLALLGLACARAFSVPAALLTTCLIAFGALLPAGGPFTPDLLFSVLLLLTWICCIAALKRNSLWLYGLIGLFSALTNLTAPTATSLVVVFACVSTLRWLWGWIMEHWSEGGGTTLWVKRNHWLGMLLLAVMHLLALGPMLSDAHREFGDATPFHWRWFDDAEQLRKWTETHPTPASIQKLSEDQRPGLESYRATHSTEEIRRRLKAGFAAVVASILTFAWAEGDIPRGGFAAAMAGILGVMLLLLWFVVPRASHAGQALHPETAPIVFFTLLALAACVMDFGWDMPVLEFGHRVLALYPPLVLSLVWACEALVRRLRRRRMRVPVFFIYQMALWILCAAAAWWLIAFLQRTSSTA